MTITHTTSAIILAAGKGTRMKSDKPKVIHEIQGKPMILYPIATLQSLGIGQIITVVKHQAELVIPIVQGLSDICFQQGDEYGTSKAIESALPVINKDIENIMVFNGDDSAFYEQETIMKVLNHHVLTQSSVTFVTLKLDNPTGYGRIVYNDQGDFQSIVEEKDASEEQKMITEVNDGLYIFNKKFVESCIHDIQPSVMTGEYYITELIRLAVEKGHKVSTYLLSNTQEFFGISTQEDLQKANDRMQSTKQTLHEQRMTV